MKMAAVPSIKGLYLDDIYNAFKRNAEVLPFLPDRNDLLSMDRQWLCNVINTVLPVEFELFVVGRRKDRRTETLTQ